MRSPGGSRRTRSPSTSTARRAIRALRGTPVAIPFAPRTRRASLRSRESWTSSSSSSARRRRSSTGWPTRCARAGSRSSGRAGRPPRSKVRRASRRRSCARPAVPTARTLPIARVPCVIKVDGLAAGRASSSARPRPSSTSASCRRGVRRAAGDRGAPRRNRGLGLRALRRRQRDSAAVGAGLQARVRRRRRPEHRRDGLFSPAPEIDVDELLESIHRPVLAELARRDAPFVGVLFAGVMLTETGRAYSSSTAASVTRRRSLSLPRIEGPWSTRSRPPRPGTHAASISRSRTTWP